MIMVSEWIEAEAVSPLDNSQMKPNWSTELALKTLCGTELFLESIPHSELLDGKMYRQKHKEWPSKSLVAHRNLSNLALR